MPDPVPDAATYDIRPALRGEIPRVAQMLRAMLTSMPYYSEAHRAFEMRRMTASFLEEQWTIEPWAVTVAVAGAEVIAFTINVPENGVVFIHWSYADPQHRRHGTARKVFDAILKAFSGRCYSKFVTVSRTDNRRANLFMKSVGFGVVCEMKNHWFGEDFYYWERALPQAEPYLGQTGALALPRRIAIRLRHAVRDRLPRLFRARL